MKKITIGGDDEAVTYKWDKKTYLEFGEIVFKLLSTDRKKRIDGYNDYYKFIGHFLLDEWNAMMDRLNEFRRSAGVLTIPEIISTIRIEKVTDYDVFKDEDCITDNCLPASVPLIVTLHSFSSPEPVYSHHSKELNTPVQMSLF